MIVTLNPVTIMKDIRVFLKLEGVSQVLCTLPETFSTLSKGNGLYLPVFNTETQKPVEVPFIVTGIFYRCVQGEKNYHTHYSLKFAEKEGQVNVAPAHEADTEKFLSGVYRAYTDDDPFYKHGDEDPEEFPAPPVEKYQSRGLLDATSRDLRLAAHLLKMAGGEFSNHGCNDFDLTPWYPSAKSRVDLDREMHEWNGDPEEHDPASADHEYGDDWLMMSLMRAKLLKLAEAMETKLKE